MSNNSSVLPIAAVAAAAAATAAVAVVAVREAARTRNQTEKKLLGKHALKLFIQRKRITPTRSKEHAFRKERKKNG